MNNSNTQSFKIISNHGIVEVVRNHNTSQNSLHAAKIFERGEIISTFSPELILKFPTYLTVQTGHQEHITLRPSYLQFINHSCNPNVFFDTSLMQLIALKNIEVGEELVFFYPSTEWQMTQSFQCMCESKHCLKFIQGANYLNQEEVKKYLFTDFIGQLLKQKFPVN